MKDYISLFRCYGCDHSLTTNDLENYDVFDGLCEECFNIAMEAAYDGKEDLDE